MNEGRERNPLVRLIIRILQKLGLWWATTSIVDVNALGMLALYALLALVVIGYYVTGSA
jgi:hypothetical protein